MAATHQRYAGKVTRIGNSKGIRLDAAFFKAQSDTDIAEILRLPVEERLRLVELIWASIAADPSTIPLGDAHRKVIDERLAEHDTNPDDVVTRDEVLAEARRG